MNNSIFIPIISIPQLMADNSEFYKEFSFDKTKEDKPIKIDDSTIKGFGRAVLPIMLRPENSKCKEIKAAGGHPIFTDAEALIDTGASISAIHIDLVKQLKLKSFKGSEITGLNKKPKKMRNVNLSIHIVDVFPDCGYLNICPTVSDFGQPIEKSNDVKFKFIIGWDILQYCELKYNGVNRTFDLKYIGNSRQQ